MANKKKVHILVVSDPPAAPGYLPRLRYLCDYLMRKGYAVTLLTEEYEPLTFSHTYPIETIRLYNGGTLDWLIKTVWTLLTDWHNRVFAKKYLTGKAALTERPVYDLVLCTAFSDFPLGAAQRIAKALNVPLVCDIRDLDEQVDDSKYQYKHRQWWLMPFRRLYRAVHIRRRNAVLRTANAITTVSPWHAEFIKNLISGSEKVAVHTIYNGFDQAQFYPEDIRTKQFTITYIGSLFDWQQPALEKVKQAVNELNSEQSSVRIQLDMHTPQNHPVPYDRLGDAIRRSGIMLVLTSPNTHGMLTTKFYEALGCAKPILCVPSDQGALAELIMYTNAGIATDDIETIKAFIMQHYRAWEQNGFTRQPTQHREQFCREAQCEQMEQILQLT